MSDTPPLYPLLHLHFSSPAVFYGVERPTTAGALRLLLLMAGVEPNPGPLTILQFNINGLRRHLDELLTYAHVKKIDVLALQETKMGPKAKNPPTPGYTLLRKDRTTTGGGVAFLVRDDIPYSATPTRSRPPIEEMTIKIGDIVISNLYIPPASSCPANFMPSIAPLLAQEKCLVIGDLNAHDPSWCSALADPRGAAIAEEIDEAGMGVMNDFLLPTRVPTNGRPTSPDVTAASPSLLAVADWSVDTALSSDHLPVLISLPTQNEVTKTPAPKRTFVNFKKANWDDFTLDSEEAFRRAPIPTSTSTGERTFRAILLKAAKRHIPAGRHPTIKHNPPQEAVDLMQQRDALRASNNDSPRIAALNAQITSIMREDKTRRWREHVETLNNTTDSSKLWTTIKTLNGVTKTPPNCAINFSGKDLAKAMTIANSFNKQFTSIHPAASDPNTRRVVRNAKRRPLNCPDDMLFHPRTVKNCIRKAKGSKAIGPDGLNMLHLKHLGQLGLGYLTLLFNLSISKCNIPAIWKMSTIIPLPKPGKNVTESSAYRPISLLSPAVKILEALILPEITKALPPAPHQHGFRPGHSTTTALAHVTNTIARGFNQNKPPDRSVLVAVDLSKAFDCVKHDALITDICNSPLPPHLQRWLSAYLRGRKARTCFRGALSTARTVRSGVPQGSVISPALFNSYVANIPVPPPDILAISYADDFTLIASGKKIPALGATLSSYLDRLAGFFDSRGLMVSPTKTTVTLLTPDTKEANLHPNVRLKNILLPLEKTPKILGVTLDTMFSYATHTKTVAAKVNNRVNIMRALSGTDWGHQKELLMMTYKAIARPILDYAAPIWSHAISKTNQGKLQVAQNAALRIVTGCHSAAHSHHLHQEAHILPVREHHHLLTAGFAICSEDVHHPCHSILTEPTPPRRMKSSLTDATKSRRAAIPPTIREKKRRLAALHQAVVRETRHALVPNRVLNTRPPPVHQSERSLNRLTRRHLAQLRSGFCHLLGDYKARLDAAASSTCRRCRSCEETVNHIFACPATPMESRPLSLWMTPIKAAEDLAPFGVGQPPT